MRVFFFWGLVLFLLECFSDSLTKAKKKKETVEGMHMLIISRKDREFVTESMTLLQYISIFCCRSGVKAWRKVK